MRRWRRLRCYVDTAKAFGLLLLTLVMKVADEVTKHARLVGIILSVALVWIIYSRFDPCHGRKITTKLCNDYYHGEISGSICPQLCREESIYLTWCTENGEEKSFWWGKMLMRVPADLERDERELTLVEGLLPSEFLALLLDYLNLQLGNGDMHNLARELKKFGDFNDDGKLSLGEAQSLWRLVHKREFLVMFIFQHSYGFPALNGTCGSLFGFQYPDVSAIYNKNVFPLNILSSSAHTWFLPSWQQRAKVAVGILDVMFDIYEDNHIKFFMCDVKPTAIGHGPTHEAIVTDARHIYSSAMLANALENRTCSHDHHCHFSHYCTTMCDTRRQQCTGEITKPTLWQACHLLREYLLFDAPPKLKPTLERLLSRCSHLIIYGQSIDMSHVVLITDLKTILWDHIKNMDVR
ncbi:divergent protein kinase domain 1B-like [Littorina saxatilis]|uniref:divergent protein kinase domain 1B-like n=1 Tax=Littorina saxatilis TaxID=31220 RepID=UPI0038B4EA4D